MTVSKIVWGHVFFPLGLPYLLEFLFKKLDIWNPNLAYDLGEAKRFEFLKKNCDQIYNYFIFLTIKLKNMDSPHHCISFTSPSFCSLLVLKRNGKLGSPVFKIVTKPIK